jgi:hypothetical protein
MRTGHCAAALPAPADRAGKTTVGAGIGAPGLIGTDHVNPDVEVLLDQIDGVVIIYVCRSLIGKVWRRAAATSRTAHSGRAQSGRKSGTSTMSPSTEVPRRTVYRSGDAQYAAGAASKPLPFVGRGA